MFGAGTVTWNDEPVTGVGGLLLSVVMAPVMVLLFSVVIWLFLVVGNWLYTRFGGITIHYWPEDYP